MLEGQQFELNGRLAQFMRMIDAFERDDIETAVDALIARLDARDGDPDLEDGNDAEPSGDELDASFPEWRPGDREVPSFSRNMRSALDHEDAEADDEDQCLAGDDGLAPVMTAYGLRWGADMNEGVEPNIVPPEWRPTPIPANDTVPA